MIALVVRPEVWCAVMLECGVQACASRRPKLLSLATCLARCVMLFPYCVDAARVTSCTVAQGVYFADCVSKSANYCFTSPDKSTGLMLLCEVALGKPRDLLQADYHAASLPAGHHSTKGACMQASASRDELFCNALCFGCQAVAECSLTPRMPRRCQTA